MSTAMRQQNVSVRRRTSYRALRARRAGGARAGALVALSGALLFGGGALAFRYLNSRPAEAAIEKLIPADAELTVTLDLKPSSPEQVRAYKRIADAWEREGLQARLDRFFRSADGKAADPLARDLMPLADSGVALAAWRLEGASPDAAFLVSVKDAGGAEGVLRRSAGHSESREGLTVYELDVAGSSGASRTVGAVIDRYAVFAGRPATLLRIRDVARGRAPSLATVAAFAEARAGLPRDANLMAFVSPEGMRSAANQPAGWARNAGLRMDPTRGAGWAAASVTVRDGGLAFDWRGPWNAEAMPGLSRVGAIAGIEPEGFDRLPSGALGVMALAQPAAYGEAVRDAAREEPELRRGWEDGVRSFERESGLSVEDEVFPAFRGDALLAVYPTADGRDVDALAVIDDARGADPAHLADALRRAVERADAPVRFASEERDGGRATVWTVTATDAHSRESVFSPANRNRGEVKYAQVGKGVVVATSPELLDRAVASYGGGGRADGLMSVGVAGGFRGMRGSLVPGAQWALLVSPSRIREAVRPALEEQMRTSGGGGDVSADDLLALFGADSADTGLVASARYDGKAYVGSVFLPFDYDRAAGLAAKAMRE